MTRPRRRTPAAVDAQDVPALAAFARAYLHEDVLLEHGDAAGAVAAFCADAGPDSCGRLADALARLADRARAWTPATIARVFSRDLGAAWSPHSAAELDALSDAARQSGRAR